MNTPSETWSRPAGTWICGEWDDDAGMTRPTGRGSHPPRAARPDGLHPTRAARGLDTDARMVAVRWKEGQLIGAALLDGTRLVVEGEGEVLRSEKPTLLGAVRVGSDWVVEEGVRSPNQ